MSNESNIYINGHLLNESQSMTVRVAIESFSSDLIENGLGDDDVGIGITKGYLQKISEMRKFMYE